MKQCVNCGQELTDQETICPSCGQNTEAAAPAETDGPAAQPVYETPVMTQEEWEETQRWAWGACGLPARPEGAKPEDAGSGDDTSAAKKKRSPLPVILTAIIALLVVVVVCLTITLTTLSSTGEMPGVVTTVTDWWKQVTYKPDAVAVNITDQEGGTLADMTNKQLGYYYWGEVYYYVQNSGAAFDLEKPFDQQQMNEEQTVQDYFVDAACKSMVQTEALKAEAEAAGFTMPEEFEKEYQATVDSMADYAVQTGFTLEDGTGDVLAYVQDSYGPKATVEDFQQYLYDSYYVTAYSDSVFQGLSFSDEEIETYYDENSDMFASYGIEKADTPNVNVRHILIQPEQAEDETEISDAAWDEAKAEAEDILKRWQSGDATEDTFGTMAAEHSQDGGSSANGGLYENVYPGQMVEEFNDWCFDKERKPGDVDIVKTTYGYHIIYFVSATEEYYWKTAAEGDLRYTTYQKTLADMAAKYTAAPTKKLQLPVPDAIGTMAKQIKESANQNALGTVG